MLPITKKTATMEDKLLKAALTVVDGCPAGAAAVVPEGVRAAVVVPEHGGNGSVTHTQRNKKTPEKRSFACGLAYKLSSFKFIVHIRTEGRFFRRSSAIFLVFLKLQKQKAS